jgi:hypothetical protein
MMLRVLRCACCRLQVSGSFFICRGEKSFAPTNGGVNNKVRNL